MERGVLDAVELNQLVLQSDQMAFHQRFKLQGIPFPKGARGAPENVGAILKATQ